MANTAPYQVDVDGSDDETFAFTLPFEGADGSAFPFADYAIEYAVNRDGCPVLSLTQAAGITVVTPAVTFKAARGLLPAGSYEHGCRIRHLVTGDELQVFDGTVTISEGQFR